ncbi:MAG: hypothetical protein ACPL6C_00920 [bacterium]
MKRLALIISLVFIAAISVKYESYKKKEYIQSGDKYYTYYSFDTKTPLIANIVGPSRYKVYIRGEKGGTKVGVELDGKKIKEVETLNELSRLGFRGKESHVTKALSFRLKIEKGKHRIKLLPSDGVCYARIAKQKSLKWIKKTPDSYGKEVELLINGKSYSYFKSTKDNPLVVNLKKASKIRIYSRVIIENTKIGKQSGYSFIVETSSGKTVISIPPLRSSSGILDGKSCSKASIKMMKLAPKDKTIKIYPVGDEPVYFTIYIKLV